MQLSCQQGSETKEIWSYLPISAMDFVPCGVLFVLCTPPEWDNRQSGSLMTATNCLYPVCLMLSVKAIFPDSDILAVKPTSKVAVLTFNKLQFPGICAARLQHQGQPGLPLPSQQISHHPLDFAPAYETVFCRSAWSLPRGSLSVARPRPMETRTAKQPLHLCSLSPNPQRKPVINFERLGMKIISNNEKKMVTTEVLFLLLVL